MRRSSPVQQWLDSLPADTETDPEQPTDLPVEQTKHTEPKSEDVKTETITENTIIEPADKTVVKTEESSNEDNNLDIPIPTEQWKRKSLESAVLTSTPQSGNIKKKLQRDHSIQSEGYVPKIKNPLLRDHSLQVIIFYVDVDCVCVELC